jgi:hypothetical protein
LGTDEDSEINLGTNFLLPEEKRRASAINTSPSRNYDFVSQNHDRGTIKRRQKSQVGEAEV